MKNNKEYGGDETLICINHGLDTFCEKQNPRYNSLVGKTVYVFVVLEGRVRISNTPPPPADNCYWRHSFPLENVRHYTTTTPYTKEKLNNSM